MAWVKSPPTSSVPLPLAGPLIFLAPIPHTPLLLLVAAHAVYLLDAKTLLPLAVHARLAECLEAHGDNVEAALRHVSVDSAALERTTSADVFVKTESNFVLVFHVFINYTKSLYEVSHATNTDWLLQNGLPLAAANTKHSLSAMLKSATRSLINGAAIGSGMASVEHFEHAAADDEQRNDNIPQIKVSLYKILKLSCRIWRFWCKSNSQNLIFANEDNRVQLLNTKTFNNESVDLTSYPWFSGTSFIEYNVFGNYFVHVDGEFHMALLELDRSDEETGISIEHTPLTQVQSAVKNILFNPQSDLLLLQTAVDVRLYNLSYGVHRNHKLSLIKTLAHDSQSVRSEYNWSPCGQFLTCIDPETRSWRMLSKFGCLVFDSDSITSELSIARVTALPMIDEATDFCKISHCAVSSNAQILYLINSQGSRLYKLDLVRLCSTSFETVLLYDDNYIDVFDPSQGNVFARVPLPPFCQKILADLQWINGTVHRSLPNFKRPYTKRATGYFVCRCNKFSQLSLSFGQHVAISTPIKTGYDYNQVYWYHFYNHTFSQMNVVDHFWIDDLLVLVNRVERDDIDGNPDQIKDPMIDELMLLNTAASRLGTGGVAFKFDSDLLVWKHTFKNQLLQIDTSEDKLTRTKTVVLATSDMKIVIMEFNMVVPATSKSSTHVSFGASKISIRVRRTIHLSSIKNMLHISSLQDMWSIDERHFFFLLNNGDFYLLKNQILETEPLPGNFKSGHMQTNNMYDLIKISNVVERIRKDTVMVGTNESVTLVSVYKGDEVHIYDLRELIERTYEFAGVETPDDVDQETVLEPLKIQTSGFTPLKLSTTNGSIGLSGFEWQVLFKNENMLIKQRPSRLMVLNRLVHRDLFSTKLSTSQIIQKYKCFDKFSYCLELMLFEELDNLDQQGTMDRLCELVNSTDAADSIYVNFLRKIEVHYWPQFFQLLRLTPLEFMNKLIDSENVDLCYSYLSIYLNYKKEHERVNSPGGPDDDNNLLGKTEQAVIMKIFKMLEKTQQWNECFELCRFIKLLQPSGELLREVRRSINANRHLPDGARTH